MSSLRLINKTTISGSQSATNITDVFSADFSICEHSSIVFGENDPLK